MYIYVHIVQIVWTWICLWRVGRGTIEFFLFCVTTYPMDPAVPERKWDWGIIDYNLEG